MITVEKMGKTHIRVRGHAGSAEYGHDLVCAAVSALAVALAANLQEVPEKEILLESGNACLSCPCTPEGKQLFDCFWKGFQILGDLFPENVQIMG